MPKSRLEHDPGVDVAPKEDFQVGGVPCILKPGTVGGVKKRCKVIGKQEVHPNQLDRYDVSHLADMVLVRVLDDDYRKTQKTLYVKIKDLHPAEIVNISLACGFTCEDSCILGSCITVMLGLSLALLGMFLYVTTELSEEFTALWGMFAFFVLFACSTTVFVYLNRTDADSTIEEKEREAKKAEIREAKRKRMGRKHYFGGDDEGDELLADVVTVV